MSPSPLVRLVQKRHEVDATIMIPCSKHGANELGSHDDNPRSPFAAYHLLGHQ